MGYSVLACITGSPGEDAVLFAARQKARALGVAWCAVYMHKPPATEDPKLPETLETLLSETKAKALGGVVARESADTVEGVANFLHQFAAQNGETIHVFVGMRRQPWQRWFWQPSFAHALGEGVSVHKIPLNVPVRFRGLRQLFGGDTAREMLLTFVAVAAVTGTVKIIEFLNPSASFLAQTENVSILYLIVCMLASILYGFLPGLISGLLSLLAVNYYFSIPPYTFYIDSWGDFFHALLFLLASFAIALIGSGARYNVLTTRQRERQLHALLSLSRTLNLSLTQQAALEHLYLELKELLHRDVAYFLPPPDDASRIAIQYPNHVSLDADSQAALNICWLEYVPTGFGTGHINTSAWRFQPMLSNRGFGGAIGVYMDEKFTDETFGQLLEGLADLSATILERIDITSIAEQRRMHEEKEKLHSMLMSSVSHDLKTPLASVIGSLNAYHSMYDALGVEQRRSLTETALQEAIRLDHFITNILDLAKMENGKILLKPESSNLLEIVNHAVRRLGARLNQHRLQIRAPGTTEAICDPGYTGQMLYHLLDNAAKYSPLHSTITIDISGSVLAGYREIRIRDEGPGVEPSMRYAIFNKYTRLKNTDRQVAGTGLGLTISRLIAENQQGTLHMENHEQGGAVFIVRLPAKQH